MATTKWTLDPTHSELGFKIRHLMITNVSGTFKTFSAEAETEDLDFTTARVSLTADMNSISTNNEQRDGHLRNADFFETDKHPQLTFRSTKLEKKDAETFILHGDLTMKGITKPVKLDVEFNGLTKDPWGGERAGFVVTGKINRTEWGLSFNAALETGGLMLGEDVKISAEVQLVKQGNE
jgi:polyisoprenoid-binding protein YceI